MQLQPAVPNHRKQTLRSLDVVPAGHPQEKAGRTHPRLQLESDIDHQIRAYCDTDNYAAATQLILTTYGHQVRAFLNSRTRDDAVAEEVFSVFSENIWKGLPNCRFQGKVISWVFAIARNALANQIRARKRWGNRHVLLESDEIPTATQQSLEAADAQQSLLSRLNPLLEDLSPADRRLLQQRLLWSKRWSEIAKEQLQTEYASTVVVSRESARLRKRYQLLVQRLREQLTC